MLCFITFPSILFSQITLFLWFIKVTFVFQLVKRANKRKAEEPDFEEKRLNLSINVNEKNIPDYDKENEYMEKPHRRPTEMNSYK